MKAAQEYRSDVYYPDCRDDDRAWILIGHIFVAASGALIGWLAHMIMVVIRNA